MEESKELVQTEINEIKEEQYGAVISQQVNKIKEIEDKIKKAKTAAETAKKNAKNLNVEKKRFPQKKICDKKRNRKYSKYYKRNGSCN